MHWSAEYILFHGNILHNLTPCRNTKLYLFSSKTPAIGHSQLMKVLPSWDTSLEHNYPISFLSGNYSTHLCGIAYCILFHYVLTIQFQLHLLYNTQNLSLT